MLAYPKTVGFRKFQFHLMSSWNLHFSLCYLQWVGRILAVVLFDNLHIFSQKSLFLESFWVVMEIITMSLRLG